MSEKKNVVFWIGVRSEDPLLKEKHNNFDYLEYSKQTWLYWCEKHNVIFFEYNTPSISDTGIHKVTWQRWFDVFDQLEQVNINYNKILLTDGSIMVKWDTPSIFDLANHSINAFRSLENINWIDEGVRGYQSLFPEVKFDLKQYVSCGFQIFDKTHKSFLEQLKKFYFDNLETILELQSKVGRGTDQPVYNYLLQQNSIKANQHIPASYWLMHMNRFNWFAHNWQLNEDKTSYFIKYGYIWVFSGFDRRQRGNLMKQTWEMIKDNYNE